MSSTEDTCEDLLDFRDEKVLLTVGPDVSPWSINRQHLERSPSRRNMLECQRWPATPPELQLPDVDPRVLRAYLHFLSTNKAPKVGMSLLVDLQVYGERIADERIKSAVLRALSEHVRRSKSSGLIETPDEDHIEVIYENSSTDSAARRLLVDIHHEFGHLSHPGKTYHKDFVHDLTSKRYEKVKDVPDLVTNLVVFFWGKNSIFRESD